MFSKYMIRISLCTSCKKCFHLNMSGFRKFYIIHQHVLLSLSDESPFTWLVHDTMYIYILYNTCNGTMVKCGCLICQDISDFHYKNKALVNHSLFVYRILFHLIIAASVKMATGKLRDPTVVS